MSDPHRFRAWLAALPPSRLVDWIEQASVAYRPLAIAMEAEQKRSPTGTVELTATREAIRELTEPPAHATWRQASEIGNAAALICLLLEHAIADGGDGAVVELIEFALQRTEHLAMAVHDSEDWSGTLFEQLSGIHLKACRQACPDRVQLARRWHRLLGQSELGAFARFPRGYEEILGENGLAEWNRLTG